MLNILLVALRVTAFTLVLTGLAYPLAVTGLAQVLFPGRANGSLVLDERGTVVGSALLAQGFSNAAYFQPRPSAAGEHGHDPTASGGANLGPTSAKLKDRMAVSVQHWRVTGTDAPVPADLVTASASGLDPHVSPAAARWQVARVARARGVAPERVAPLVELHVEERELGFLGEPRVNVLELNLALDRLLGRPLPGVPGNGE